jgi:hypothetical protein
MAPRAGVPQVYRRDQPQMARGRFREFFQCDFDIAGSYPTMVPDAEVLKVGAGLIVCVCGCRGGLLAGSLHQALLPCTPALCPPARGRFGAPLPPHHLLPPSCFIFLLLSFHFQVLVGILDELSLGEYEVKLNHRRLLDAMLDIAGVPPAKFRPICSAIDKLDKEPWEAVRAGKPCCCVLLCVS